MGKELIICQATDDGCLHPRCPKKEDSCPLTVVNFASQESRQITGKLRGKSLKRWEDLKWILQDEDSERPASDAKVMDYLINNFFDTL